MDRTFPLGVVPHCRGLPQPKNKDQKWPSKTFVKVILQTIQNTHIMGQNIQPIIELLACETTSDNNSSQERHRYYTKILTKIYSLHTKIDKTWINNCNKYYNKYYNEEKKTTDSQCSLWGKCKVIFFVITVMRVEINVEKCCRHTYAGADHVIAFILYSN